MTSKFDFGTILEGSRDAVSRAYERFASLPIDQDWTGEAPAERIEKPSTIERSCTVSAPGTFSKNQISTLRLESSERPGWYFERLDLPESYPVKVSVRNVWTTGDVVSNIVLRSGSKSNYVRLVEHIIALKLGLNIDNLLISMDSGDPPLFNRGSDKLLEALQSAGRRELPGKVRYFTVRETATFVTPHDGFLTIAPCDPDSPRLEIDCARDFPNAIGQQRIRFVLNEKSFVHGALARTNATSRQKLFIETFGKLFADARNLGYNRHNVLVAGKGRYLNEPALMHEGKSLEAVWHRAVLDLLAALALIEEGRFIGRITDFKGGHFADVEMVKLLYANGLLVEV